MVEELGSLYECMPLIEQEQKEIHVEASFLEDVILKGNKCAIMKLFTEKYYHKEMFKQTMKNVGDQLKE